MAAAPPQPAVTTTMCSSCERWRRATASGRRALMGEHLDHILGDLDLARGAGGPVDVAAVLREGLALA